jgi:cytochrome b pre-mRNA-processing protein 3
MIKRWLENKKRTQIAHELYCSLVEQARNPVFYEQYAVEDTLEGRLDMILLHMFLMVRYLKNSQQDTQRLIQILQEVMIRDIDRSLREIGVGDMNVGKQMKGVGASWLGRLKVYTDAVDALDAGGDKQLLHEALLKNIYRCEDVSDTPEVAKTGAKEIAAYILSASSDVMLDQNKDSDSTGKVYFPDFKPGL